MKSDRRVVSDAWRKSSYSGGSAANCLEVADGATGTVLVRDSKNPDGPALIFSAAAFASFVGAVRLS
ncbi:DUF397 domain-containing protein [Streptomyces sp. NPDC052496]|uniref:DUF397 domain-containing protein n=1 Tax=Streptomyces sp. NPDC052496 TaxID=3154951 RepID=UPI00342EA74E